VEKAGLSRPGVGVRIRALMVKATIAIGLVPPHIRKGAGQRRRDRVEKPSKWTSAGWLISEIAEGLAGI
jgi:hypothetical protein